MRLRKFVRLLAVAASLPLLFAACSEDPTDAGAGDAFAIVTNRSSTIQAAGSAFTVTAQVVDRLGTPLPIPVVASSSTPASVVVDSTVYVPELQETRFYLRSLGVNASVPVVLTAAILTDTLEVKVLSGPFPGTVATAAFSGGTVLQFTSATNLFDANTAVSVTTGEPGYLIDVTPTRVRYLLPFGQAAGPVPYSITGAGPADFSLTGSFNLTPGIACSDSFEPNNTRTTGNTSALTVGGTVYGSVNATNDGDDFFRFTVPTGGSRVVELTWTDAADIDMYLLSSTGANLAGFTAATGANPERITMTLTPGDYFVDVQWYDGGGSCTTYKLTVT